MKIGKAKLTAMLLICFLLGLFIGIIIGLIYIGPIGEGGKKSNANHNPKVSSDKGKTKANEQCRNQLNSIMQYYKHRHTTDIHAYEKLANDLDNAWRVVDRVEHARLMLEVCRPLSSGFFKEERQYELARIYAVSALEKPDEIPLAIELELLTHVTTETIGPGAFKGEILSKRRKKDLELKIHGWKRLMEALDPNWDQDEVMQGGNVAPPAETGLPPGVKPEAIKDATLRKEYEAAIQRKRMKIEKYSEQYELRRWLNKFPNRFENDIIQAYSFSPFAIEELKAMLQENLPDREAKLRIINAVKKYIQEKQKD